MAAVGTLPPSRQRRLLAGSSNAPAHALFGPLEMKRNSTDEVARDFGAYSVLFDGQPAAVGEHAIDGQPNVKLVRVC
ncbi:MAG: hypothetical protein Q8M20_10710 [Rhodocyclaceae bacterium]|nr:hypothetical protein [Rhodocyclaceae bacterium]MDZ4215359.1 hypothetical protein [Rhodocyclaceae bacterium]